MKTARNILLAIIGLCVAFLVYSYVYLNSINPAFRETAIKLLVSDIMDKCRKYKISRAIYTDISIQGPIEDKKLEFYLKMRIIAGLLAEERTPFIPIIKSKEFIDWGSEIRIGLDEMKIPMHRRTQIMGDIRQSAIKAVIPNCKPSLIWCWVPGNEGRILELILDIKIFEKNIEIHSRQVKLFHPDYEENYKKKKKSLKIWKNICSVTGGIAVIMLIFPYTQFFIRRRKIGKNLADTKEQAQNFVQTGRYVAAMGLMNDVLYYFPKESELVSFKSRLDIITKGNTRKAEEAFVRFNNLKIKYDKSRFLTPEEWKELQELPKYLDLPELNVMAGLCQRYIEMTRMGKALKDMRKEVKSLLSEGKIQQAQEKLKEIEKDSDWQDYQENIAKEPDMTERLALPGPQSIDGLRKEVDEKNESGRKKMIEVREALDRSDINTGERLLKEVRELNRELKEPEELLDKIESSRRAEKLALSPRKTGKEVIIFKKDVITAFRKEKKTPDIDINSKRVSRDRHLKLSVVENKVIAEDTGSSGGTYYRGEKIQRIEVEDGGILDLAHSYKIVVHILRGREMVQSTLVDGTVPAEMKVSAGEINRSQKVSGLFLEADDKNYIVILTAVPVGIKSIGITYEKSSPYELVVNEGVFIFKTRHEARILYPGYSLEERGVVYQIT